MTPGERKALLFLGGIGLLGAVARVATTPSAPPTRAERAALDGQIASVDSARTAAQRPRTQGPRGSKTPKRPRAPREAPATAQSFQSPPLAEPTIVDLDVADSAAIESLPGIGPALAQRIVVDRAQHGPFGSLGGLDRVRGIGPKLAARIASRVTFSGVARR